MRAGFGRRTRRSILLISPNRDKILLGGGLRLASGNRYCGGMWVPEVETGVALCEEDPLFKLGPQKGYLL